MEQKILVLLGGTVILGGIFSFGLAVFRRKIRLVSPSRPSPTFEEFFPKIFGGGLMAWVSLGWGMIVLGISGAFHHAH